MNTPSSNNTTATQYKDINTDMSYLMQKGVPSAGLGKGILSVRHFPQFALTKDLPATGCTAAPSPPFNMSYLMDLVI
jgi:hypothetical protein